MFSGCPSVRLSVRLSVRPSVCPSVRLSVCLQERACPDDNSKNIIRNQFIFGTHIYWGKTSVKFEYGCRTSLIMHTMT